MANSIIKSFKHSFADLQICRFRNSRVAGQSLFEVVFAVGMSALIITAVVILATNAIANSTFSKNKSLAGRFTQEAVEWLRGQRDTDWEAFYTNAQISPRCLPSLAWNLTGPCGESDTINSNSNFKREADFSLIGPENVEAKVKVYWEDGRGLHEVSTVTNFTDWRRQ